ncbi:hypothetical protein BB934_13910 [Microvirga ossetica]|uniref:Uncharacterized protein n=2 Tax=Microvirga ossetica TaxID=1882682 RepID=A0A1B2EGR8_9HYPH|nr:hypothetical protein BB934_13910 [Microvirga ossetica]
MAFAAFAGIVSWIASYYQLKFSAEVSAEKDRAFNQYKAEAEERTAQALADAAVAKERAASLEKEAAEARLKQEELRRTLAWRSLSASTVEKFRASLPEAGAVTLAYTANDPEALSLSLQFAEAFTQAGWQISMEARTYPDRIFFGVYAPYRLGSPNVGPLHSALSVAGIGFSTEPLPPPPMAFGVSRDNTRALLFIGSKKPPL